MVDHVVDANGNYGNISVGWNQATQTCEDADGGVAISTCIDNLRIDCSGMQRAFHLSGICFAEINALAFDIVVAHFSAICQGAMKEIAAFGRLRRPRRRRRK